MDRFATWGHSGGGPHALACAALLPERCVAAATLASVAPYGVEGLDWLEGMGEANVQDFDAVLAGPEALEPVVLRDQAEMFSAGPDGLRQAMLTILSPVDQAAFTADVAEWIYAVMAEGAAKRIEGFRDDNLACVAPWGFDPARHQRSRSPPPGRPGPDGPARPRPLAGGSAFRAWRPRSATPRATSRCSQVASPRCTSGCSSASDIGVLRPEGYTAGPMDVLVLIDKLDDLVHNAKAVPLTDQVRIDREEIYDILDQMRATIPEEIKQARWIVKERQEMLAEAKREVDRLLAEAREQAVREASQTEIVKIAERQADEIVDDARRGAREMKLEMEDWADNQLASLEVNLERFLTAVRRGRERLHERSQETVIAGLASNGDVADDERF